MEDEGFVKINLKDDFRKIIIAESVQFVANSLVRILKEEGYFVFQSPTGKSVKFLTDNYKPDVIVISERLPDMRGINLIREIRENNKGVKIILISADESFEAKQNALLAGSDYYLVKPFERDFLVSIIADLLSGKVNLQ